MKKTGKIVFILIEIILYCISLAGKAVYLDEARYIGIVLCFVYAFLCICVMKKWNCKECLILTGLFFTCIADYFLVIWNGYFTAGVAFFLVTQCFYFLYLTWCFPASRKVKLIIVKGFIAIVLFIMVSAVMKELVPLLFLLTFYIVLFVGNIVLGFQQSQGERLFTIGLVLFFCCDICVGLSNANLFFTEFPYHKIFSWLIWLFYLPSQVCISYSISKNRT